MYSHVHLWKNRKGLFNKRALSVKDSLHTALEATACLGQVVLVHVCIYV